MTLMGRLVPERPPSPTPESPAHAASPTPDFDQRVYKSDIEAPL